jgi:glycerophosphoryl diester phosphodiesterase
MDPAKRPDPPESPIIIAHRGASGYLPEHTLAAYALAIEQGADFIEPDLVSTRDGVLVARHENEISLTSDVSGHPRFADRKTAKVIDGATVEGWFTEDFTLAELRTLRARERIPRLRPANTRFDGMFAIPTLQEIVNLVRGTNLRFRLMARQTGRRTPRSVGLYLETKHPSYFRSIGLALEPPLIALLHGSGFRARHAPVFIQSFETANLRTLRAMTALRLVQLVDIAGQPYDWLAAGGGGTYADMLEPEALAEIARYAFAIGPHKDLVLPLRPPGGITPPAPLVARAHAAGLAVHAWTFRAENAFLPDHHRQGGDPAAAGDLAAEIRSFVQAGIDGLFTDQPDVAVALRNADREPGDGR